MKNGLLLINLGTPDSPTPLAVRKYLREFLADKRVIQLPSVLRYLLLYVFILPFRPKRSAHAYKAIWTKDGSPLLIHSKKLVEKLQKAEPNTKIALGMCYGNPAIESALYELRDCNNITVLPLYPQYSSAATGACIEKVLSILRKKDFIPSLYIINNFYSHPAFIKAQSSLIKPFLKESEHFLFSYHGIPERQLLQGNCREACSHSCSPNSTSFSYCYRAHCLETTALLASTLGLKKDTFSSSFQSRLGKAAWIRPYTDEILIELAKKGIKKLTVTSPSFVADCLETLEEIAIRANQQWKSLGGESLRLTPCLNDDDLWIEAIKDIVKR